MGARTEIKKTKVTYNPEQKKEKVLAYLKDKYGEEFILGSMEGSGWGQSYDSFVLHPKRSDRNDVFTVWGTLKDDGSYAMHDGYFKRLIHDSYKAELDNIVKDIYKDYKLYVDFGEGIFNDKLTKDTKVDEIYDIDDGFTSDITILVKESSLTNIDTAECLKKIAKRMVEKKLIGTVEIYLVFNDKFESTGLEKTYELPTDVKDIFMEGSRKYIMVDGALKISEVKNDY